MLRITVTENESEQKWILQGRLTERSASELVVNWKAMRGHTMTRLVDLTEVTLIDRAGERVLSMMMDDGARFISTGLYTTYLLEDLERRAESN